MGSLFNLQSDFENSFNKLSTLYNNDLSINLSQTYGMDRQHNYISLSAGLPLFSTLVDTNSVEKFYKYNFNTSNLNLGNNSYNTYNVNRLTYNSDTANSGSLNYASALHNYYKLLPNHTHRFNNLNFSYFLK